MCATTQPKKKYKKVLEIDRKNTDSGSVYLISIITVVIAPYKWVL